MPYKKVKGLVPAAERFRVKYKDVFDLKQYYIALHEWMLEHEWKDVGDDADHWETYYGERLTDPGGTKEIWFQWRPYRKPKDAPFLTYYMDFDFHCIAIKEIEIVKDGLKLKVHRGEVELYIQAFLSKDYEEAFEKNIFLKEVKEIFTNRIYRRELEQRKKELYQEAYALQNFIKYWFKLKRHLPYEERKEFFVPYAWPAHIK